MRDIRNASGFTLVEIVAVVFILSILSGMLYINVSSEKALTISSRVSSDLDMINMAKSLWRTDYGLSGVSFPIDESARFTAIKPYLENGKVLNAVTNMQPAGVSYVINGLGVDASASGL